MDDAGEVVDVGVWSPRRRSLTIGLVSTVSAAAFESLAVATVLPATVADIGGLELYGWVFSSFMLANIIGITVAGHAADRGGAARPFATGSVLFVLGLVGAGCAPSMVLLVVSRVAQGLGAGAISAVAYVAVARGYPPSAQPRLLAMLSSAWVVPGLVGPALAGVVADHLGWRWVFLGLAPLTAAATAVTTNSLRRLEPPQAAPPEGGRTLYATCLAVGTGATLAGLQGHGWYLGAALVVAGVAVALPAFRRLVPPGTLGARPGLPAAIATMGLVSAAFFGVDVFVPLSVTAVRGQPVTVAGIVLTAATLTWTAGAWWQAQLAPRRSRRELTVVGLLLIGVGVGGVAAALSPAVPVLLAAVAWGVAGLGMGFAYSTIALAVLEAAPAGQEGAASAAMQLANVLGVALGTGGNGAIVAVATTAAHSLAVAIGVVDAVAAVLVGLALSAARGLSAQPGTAKPGVLASPGPIAEV